MGPSLPRSVRFAATLLVATVAVGLGVAPPTIGAPAAVASPDPACAAPDDCRLWEAAEASGIRFGFAVRPEDPDEARIGAAEGASVINHGISWNVVEPTRGARRWGGADRVAAYARANGLDQVAMHLFWDQRGLDDLPDWVLDVDDPDELRAVIRERAHDVFDRYPDLARVDVLNEPIATGGGEPDDNHFRQVLGDDYAVELFAAAAAEAPPGVELFVNENLVEYLPAKADALVAFVRRLVEAGAQIDAVGLQSHLLAGEPDWDLYLQTMRRLAALGVSVFISELDVPVGADVADRAEQQAERYRRAVATCLAVPACDEIIVWGVSDRASWLDQVMGPGFAPLLFDVDLQPKAAYRAVRDALLQGRPAPEPDPPTTAPTTSSTTTAPPRDDPVDGPPPSVPAPPPASAVSAEPTFAG